ncbi:hypothetical protein JCM9279_007449 [Rhodotorula babjevae]
MSGSAPAPSTASDALLVKHHVLFALRNARYLPTPYQAEDSSRMTLAYFCIAALALLPSAPVSSHDPHLSALDVMLKPAQRTGFLDWVYQQQVAQGGFRGSDSLAAALRTADSARPSSSDLDNAHLIQTYTALVILGLLDDDYARLRRHDLARFVGACQNPDGSFSQFPGCPEPGDPRSTYSAFAVASMLDDWTTLDVDSALAFLNGCRRYEGGFGQRPGLEANAGPTYCAIASFSLAGRLASLARPQQLLRWLVSRQVRPPPRPPRSETSESDEEGEDEVQEEEEGQREDDSAGFQGRANKPTDACYSFWNNAALTLLLPGIDPSLSLSSILDPALDRAWLLDCQHPKFGGIAREPGALPDVMHTYLSLAALSLGDVSADAGVGSGGATLGLRALDAVWNVPREVAQRMRERLRRSTSGSGGEEEERGRV